MLELSPEVLASRPGKGLGATFDAAPGACPRRFGGVCSRGRLSGSGPLPFDPEAFPLPPFGGGQSPSAFRRSLSFFEGRR